jgi:hypothetical protein
LLIGWGVVEPGPDPSRSKLTFEGTEDIKTDPNGELILRAAGGDFRLVKPGVYQEIHGTNKSVAVRYVLVKADAKGSGCDKFNMRYRSDEDRKGL